jgi:hypothetical protein
MIDIYLEGPFIVFFVINFKQILVFTYSYVWNLLLAFVKKIN